MGEISVLLPVAIPDEDYCSSLHQSTGGERRRYKATTSLIGWSQTELAATLVATDNCILYT